MDTLSIEQRQRCMSAIRGKNTKPELLVRSMLHGMGYRFRLHNHKLPGKPDIVLPRHRKIIEVRGCFWHRHNCRKGIVEPKANGEFWREKRLATTKRDRRNIRMLRKLGWSVLVVWECEINNTERLSSQIKRFMNESSCRA